MDQCRICKKLYWSEYKEAYQWQPIETAPKDRTKFLFYDADNHMDICWWSNLDGGWISHFSDEYGRLEEPTHWMPLPDPPKEK